MAAKLRFLFQIGPEIAGIRLHDAGSVYVYGCDVHPDTVTTVTDEM